MGVSSSEEYAKKQKVISVISLNYSGILLSPFEFFSKENKEMTEIETTLSNIYKRLLKSYSADFTEDKKSNKFKWNLGKIDQKMQAERYSPLYNKSVGIENGKFIEENLFKNRWTDTFETNFKLLQKNNHGFEYKESELNEAFQFDLLCFKCLLSYVYGKELNKLTAESVQGLDVKKYEKFMDKMFNKSFLNEDKKLEKTLNAMQKEKIDILFAQEANQNLINKLKTMSHEYEIIQKEKSESIIIVKKEKFQNFFINENSPLKNLPEIEKELCWNDDTVVGFVDNLILISGHLSSKKDKNPKQIYDMMLSLKKLHAIYPMCHIIVGCDANSFAPQTFNDYCKQENISFKAEIGSKTELIEGLDIWSSFKPKNCRVFPNDAKVYTTSKERTYLQPQINKAEEFASVCRDHLIVFHAKDIIIENTRVCTILDKTPSTVPNLPSEDHPYDHYVVKAELTVNVMTHFADNKDYGCFN